VGQGVKVGQALPPANSDGFVSKRPTGLILFSLATKMASFRNPAPGPEAKPKNPE
jgi:hypothetical protein